VLNGDRLTVTNPRAAAVVDTRTFLVSPAAPVAEPKTTGIAWPLLLSLLGVLAAGGTLSLALLRRRRRLATVQ